LIFYCQIFSNATAWEHNLCVTGKIVSREKIHVRSFVGVDQKNLLNRGDAPEVRSSGVDSPSPFNPQTQRTLKGPRSSILSGKSRFCEILYYIRFVNGALLGMEWHAAVRTTGFYRTPKGFSFLHRILKRKSIFLVNRLFKNIDERSQFNRSKYWSPTSVIGETIIL